VSERVPVTASCLTGRRGARVTGRASRSSHPVQFQLLQRDAMLARYMLSSCVRPSVCLSVRLSQAGCVSNNTQTTAHDSPGTLVSGGILKMLTEYYFEIRYFYSD